MTKFCPISSFLQSLQSRESLSEINSLIGLAICFSVHCCRVIIQEMASCRKKVFLFCERLGHGGDRPGDNRRIHSTRLIIENSRVGWQGFDGQSKYLIYWCAEGTKIQVKVSLHSKKTADDWYHSPPSGSVRWVRDKPCSPKGYVQNILSTSLKFVEYRKCWRLAPLSPLALCAELKTVMFAKSWC